MSTIPIFHLEGRSPIAVRLRIWVDGKWEKSQFTNYKSQINYKKQITNLKQKPKTNIGTDLFGSFYNWKLEFV